MTRLGQPLRLGPGRSRQVSNTAFLGNVGMDWCAWQDGKAAFSGRLNIQTPGLFDGVIASDTPLSFLSPAAIEPVGYERNPVPSVF